MPSILTHPAVPFAIAGACGRFHVPGRLLLAGVIASVLPDLDSVGFHLGVPYGALFGHRGLSHSLRFAVLLAVLAALAHPSRLVGTGCVRSRPCFCRFPWSPRCPHQWRPRHRVLQSVLKPPLLLPLASHRSLASRRPTLLLRVGASSHRFGGSLGLAPEFHRGRSRLSHSAQPTRGLTTRCSGLASLAAELGIVRRRPPQ